MKWPFLFVFAMFVSIVVHAQTETIKWYVNGVLYDTTTCESGGDITPPNIDNFGYTFTGWEPAIYDMSTLDASIDADSYTKNGVNFKVVFSYGTVYGESLCSSTTNAEWYANANLNTTNGSGVYCYCRLTEFMPVGSDKIYETLSSHWVYFKRASTQNDCNAYCPNIYCASQGLKTDSTFRSKLYNAN